ncbi:ornithine cyclodeaminase family protein [Prolixibacteraceae bacterium JC049]|nr:ornithine cyclodeaminase family protein [Prolixibacteraceae bacterium JC049]
MAIVMSKEAILSIVEKMDVVAAMEKGFIEYSNGNCVVPPVGELLFDEENGETHIKYGYIKGESHYVIKVASGFYNNPQQGIPSSQGLMLVFNQKTGETEGVLLDEGHLTNIRTAAAGALATKYFAPKEIKAIGIIGAGIQARLQLQYLSKYRSCKKVYVWDINRENAELFKTELEGEFDITIAANTSELAKACNLIVTTTPSQQPLLMHEDIQQGTHITAVGSDTPEKQELDSDILAYADLVVADSIPQSKSRGEIFQAVSNGKVKPVSVLELGTAILHPQMHRRSDEETTVVDLTGVAVQDIMIALAVFKNN